MKGYYFITDSGLSLKGNESDVRNAVACGVCAVQYRDKLLNSRLLYEEALKLKAVCGKKISFIVNDRVDIALAVDADGVHLGQDDLPCQAVRRILGKNKIIGVTVHDIFEARSAFEAGADYLGVSPIFKTSTKPDAGKPAGLELMEKIKKSLRLPVIAIGGINLANSPEVVKAGADGLCAISAVVTKPDVKTEIKKFQKMFVM